MLLPSYRRRHRRRRLLLLFQWVIFASWNNIYMSWGFVILDLSVNVHVPSSSYTSRPNNISDNKQSGFGYGYGYGYDYGHPMFMSKNENDDGSSSLSSPSNMDEDNSSSSEETKPPKPMSRLAMAAADWMEEEEEDELLSYWDRYDAAKSNNSNLNSSSKDQDTSSTSTSASTSKSASKQKDAQENLTTDERLDRYFQSRGIDKSIERKYAKDIERAVSYATNTASSALDAIQTLEQVRPYMQVGSKLGGTALLELAYAYASAYCHQDGDGDNDRSDDDDGTRSNEYSYKSTYEKEFTEICLSIVEKNPLKELRLRAKQLLEDPKRYGKRYERRSFWQSFDSWWN